MAVALFTAPRDELRRTRLQRILVRGRDAGRLRRRPPRLDRAASVRAGLSRPPAVAVELAERRRKQRRCGFTMYRYRLIDEDTGSDLGPLISSRLAFVVGD